MNGTQEPLLKRLYLTKKALVNRNRSNRLNLKSLQWCRRQLTISSPQRLIISSSLLKRLYWGTRSTSWNSKDTLIRGLPHLIETIQSAWNLKVSPLRRKIVFIAFLVPFLELRLERPLVRYLLGPLELAKAWPHQRKFIFNLRLETFSFRLVARLGQFKKLLKNTVFNSLIRKMLHNWDKKIRLATTKTDSLKKTFCSIQRFLTRARPS